MAISEKITQHTTSLKALIQRSMNQKDLEQAARHCNGILAEAERVAGLEERVLVPPFRDMKPGEAEEAAGHV